MAAKLMIFMLLPNKMPDFMWVRESERQGSLDRIQADAHASRNRVDSLSQPDSGNLKRRFNYGLPGILSRAFQFRPSKNRADFH